MKNIINISLLENIVNDILNGQDKSYSTDEAIEVKLLCQNLNDMKMYKGKNTVVLDPNVMQQKYDTAMRCYKSYEEYDSNTEIHIEMLWIISKMVMWGLKFDKKILYFPDVSHGVNKKVYRLLEKLY